MNLIGCPFIVRHGSKGENSVSSTGVNDSFLIFGSNTLKPQKIYLLGLACIVTVQFNQTLVRSQRTWLFFALLATRVRSSAYALELMHISGADLNV